MLAHRHAVDPSSHNRLYDTVPLVLRQERAVASPAPAALSDFLSRCSRTDLALIAAFALSGCYLSMSDARSDEEPEPAAPPARTSSALARQHDTTDAGKRGAWAPLARWVDRLRASFWARRDTPRRGASGQRAGQVRGWSDAAQGWGAGGEGGDEVARLKRALAERDTALELQQRAFQEQAEKTKLLEQEVQRDLALLKTAAAQRSADASEIQALSALNVEAQKVSSDGAAGGRGVQKPERGEYRLPLNGVESAVRAVAPRSRGDLVAPLTHHFPEPLHPSPHPRLCTATGRRCAGNGECCASSVAQESI
jgi:hypothetical protein